MFSLKKITSSPLLLVFLSGLYPAVFAASNNWFIYSKPEIIFLLVATPLIALGIAAILYVVLSQLSKWLHSSYPKLPILSPASNSLKIGAVLYSFLTIFYLLQITFFSIVGNSITILIAAFIAVNLIAMLTVKRHDYSLFMLLLVALISVSAIQWAYSYSAITKKHNESGWHILGKKHNSNIRLATTPNIYLVVMEAYQDRTTLNKIYNFDNRETEKKLKKMGFVVYDNAFSNYADTATSLLALFTMQHHFYTTRISNNDAFGFREIIGGKLYNGVLDVLKRHNYYIQYVSHNNYSYQKGENVDFAYPERSVLNVFGIYQIDSLNRLLSSMFSSFRGHRHGAINQTDVKPKEALEVLKERIAIAAKSPVPHFTFFKHQLPGHFGGRWDKISSKKINMYLENVKKATESILLIIRQIEKNDPGSLIIIIGDHGAWRYRDIWKGEKGFHATMKKNKLPEDMLSRDLFGVVLAIKCPKGITIPDGLISHVNLFRYIFSGLAKNRGPLKTKKANESYYPNGMMAVKEGVPLKKWVSAPSAWSEHIQRQKTKEKKGER